MPKDIIDVRNILWLFLVRNKYKFYIRVLIKQGLEKAGPIGAIAGVRPTNKTGIYGNLHEICLPGLKFAFTIIQYNSLYNRNHKI